MKTFGIIVAIILIVGLSALVVWQGIKLVKDIIAYAKRKKADKQNKDLSKGE